VSAPRTRPSALRRYGQNHLVDTGTLDAILEMAAVVPDEVVLEVGAADGLLTTRLVERAGFVHAFEIDRRFVARLTELAHGEPRLHVCVADALQVRLQDLDPPPQALVANLAYNIAIPLVMRTIAQVPSIARWALMLQKELADRLFAAPRTKAYSAVSVLTQLACERTGSRPVPRTVFSPRPHVDSAFVTFRRRDDWPRERYAAIDTLVRIGFGQRRKMLTNSLEGAAHGGRAPLAGVDVRRALETLGLSPTVRPEELAPTRFVALTEALGWR
jgi:16S rRNA (adenine1518-N6/adenine1519-N6)-dimethyltransferase